jgi:hypothetical protein
MEISNIAPHAAAPDTSLSAWALEAGIDNGPETGVVQTVVRPPLAPADAPKLKDAALVRASHDLSDFALPAAQLTPAIYRLEVEAAAGWPLPHPGGARRRAAAARRPVRPRAPSRRQRGRRAGRAARRGARATARDGRAGRRRGRAGRRMVRDAHPVAAPGARHPHSPARPARRRRPVAARPLRGTGLPARRGSGRPGLGLRAVAARRAAGAVERRRPPRRRRLRVEARLQWSAPPHEGQWCHARVVKEHHPRSGRQLVACGSTSGETATHVACEVQLGPVLARSVRWCDVCVRINAVQRFWNALGAQWSVHVVVSAMPLAGVRVPPQEEASW